MKNFRVYRWSILHIASSKKLRQCVAQWRYTLIWIPIAIILGCVSFSWKQLDWLFIWDIEQEKVHQHFTELYVII